MKEVKNPCVVSVAEHAGWAHVVSVAARNTVPVVVERRRVTLIESGLPTQPYHHDSLRMTEDAANALIARVKRSIDGCARDALQRLIAELATSHTVVAVAIRQSPFPALPETVAAAWGTQLLYSADGMLYQQAVCEAARQLGLDLHVYPRGGQELALAAERVGVTPQLLERFIVQDGRPPGPPWQQEHRRAYAAGIAALSKHVSGRLRIPTT